LTGEPGIALGTFLSVLWKLALLDTLHGVANTVKPDADRLELFRRMVFNAMVTNNDDHPRNHAMLRTPGGWRLSPAYDIVPVPLISLERRDLALEVGRYGRVASVYNLLSDCASFGLHREEERSIEYVSGAILPECFFRTEPHSAQ